MRTASQRRRAAGQLSFVESLSVLDRQPQRLGCDRTIVFFNDSRAVPLAASRTSDLCDVRTGVICSPNNFAYAPDDGELADNLIRITALANFDRWQCSARRALSAGKAPLVRPAGRLGRAVHPRFSQPRDRHRHVHADDDPPLHGPRERRRSTARRTSSSTARRT